NAEANASASDESPGEIDPAVAFDAAGQLEIMIDLGGVFRRHGGDLPSVINSGIVELLDDLRPDARQFGEIVGGAARGGKELENFARRIMTVSRRATAGRRLLCFRGC